VVLPAVLLIHAQWPWLWPLWGAVLGAVLGSFTACMIERKRAGIGLRQPPSHCPHCKTVLRVADLLPIVSWLYRCGRCRYCQAPIPKGLLFAELVGAALGSLLVWSGLTYVLPALLL
jgi:prepilin signal peptidase PulO-like enzyme (type II secretory pathway)